MKTGILLALGPPLVLVTMAPTHTAWAGPSVPTGAYITRPVVSGQDLARLVRASPVVRQRYEKAWGLSTAETLQHFVGIRQGKLPQTAMLNVYYFRPSTGSWGYKLRRVKRGTPVFLRGDGTPVMLKVCGNPIAMPVKPLSPQEQAKVSDFTPDESIEALQTDTPPPADPLAFPEAQRMVALEESGAPLPQEPPGPPETADSAEAPLKEKRHSTGFPLPFNILLAGLGSSAHSGLGGGGEASGFSTANPIAPEVAPPAGTSVGTVVRTPTLAPPRTLVAYIPDLPTRGSDSQGASEGESTDEAGRSVSLSAPEPSLALMVSLLPVALWATQRRTTR